MSKGYRPFHRSPARDLLPRTVTYLGELSAMIIRNPETGDYHTINYVPDRVLMSAPDGRAMFVLMPVIESTRNIPTRYHRQALAAAELHSRFVHREADAIYNCVVPAFRKPVYCGELHMIEYTVHKDLEEGDDGDDEPQPYVHYFVDEQTGALAPAELWQVGKQQYVIPPGPWEVTDRGIVYAAQRAA